VPVGDALPIRRRHMEPGLEAAILPLVLAASIFGGPCPPMQVGNCCSEKAVIRA